MSVVNIKIDKADTQRRKEGIPSYGSRSERENDVTQFYRGSKECPHSVVLALLQLDGVCMDAGFW